MESAPAGKIGPLEKFFRTPFGGILYVLWVTFITIFVFILIGQGLIGGFFDYGFLILGERAEAAGNALWASIFKSGAVYTTFLGIWIISVLFLAVFPWNRFILKKIGPGGGNSLSMLLKGAGWGMGLNLFCAVVGILHGDIVLYFNRFDPLPVLLLFLLVAIQSSAEELVFRGYMFRKIAIRYPIPLFAAILNALLFLTIHLGNPGVSFLGLMNIFLVGVLTSLVVACEDSFFWVAAFHTTWNFMQAFILGLPNSGLVASYSIFKLEAASARNSFAYNTGFGIEGTVTSTIVIAALIAFLCLKYRKEGKLKFGKSRG